MREPYRRLMPRLRAEAKRLLERSPRCHDWDHTLRVLRTARRIARSEKADLAVVEYAALLHDIGRPLEMASAGRACHAETGARRVPRLLRTVGVRDEDFIRRHILKNL